MRSHDSGWFEHVLTSALRQLFLIRSPFECLQRTARQLKYRQHQLVCSRADRRSIMNTPLLWMIAADCHGPGRTRAICLYKDVKHVTTARAPAKRTWPAIGVFVIGCAHGAVYKPALGLRSHILSTAFALLALVLGLVANLQHGVTQNSLQARHRHRPSEQT